METKGIMAEIREHLAKGKSSREVIHLGFAPGTVYKVRRQLTRGENLPVKPKVAKDETPAIVGVEDTPDDNGEWIEDWETPNEEFELLQSQIRRAEARIAELQAQVSDAHSILLKATELEQQVELLTRQSAAQQKELTHLQERWDQVMPILAAVCTGVDSFSETVEADLPEHARLRFNEAMELIRKHSGFKGESVEQDLALIASLSLPPVSRGR